MNILKILFALGVFYFIVINIKTKFCYEFNT